MGEWDVEHLEHRGHLRLTRLAAPSLGDVEDQIDRAPQPAQGLERILVGLDVDTGVAVGSIASWTAAIVAGSSNSASDCATPSNPAVSWRTL